MITRWLLHANDPADWRMHTSFPVSVPKPRCAVCSVTRRPVSSRSHGGQKTGLQRLWACAFGLVRPQGPRVRDLSCGDTRVYLYLELRRVACRRCGKVKRERLDFLADNPLYTKRFAHYVGRRCASATIKAVAKELHLDWHTVKALDKQYMRTQLARAGTPGPKAIGIDEILHSQGTHLPHRGQRSHPLPADLVRWRGPFRGEYGAVL